MKKSSASSKTATTSRDLLAKAKRNKSTETTSKKQNKADNGFTLPNMERVQKILELLEKEYPAASCALHFSDPLQLLIATILSAQCTDERVNKVTPVLFQAYPDAASLAAAPIERLEGIIHSTGFFHAKAKAIKGSCGLIMEKFGGHVPREMEQLLDLPGVARKTANVVLGSAYGLATGIVVDTHVKRLAQRLGLSINTDPNKIEADLMKLIPQNQWIAFSHQLILHGRAVCHARNPKHENCLLAPYCPSKDL